MSIVDKPKVKNKDRKKRRGNIYPSTGNQSSDTIDIATVKEKTTLEEDYKLCLKCIEEGSLEKFKAIISNKDNKWYLENNDDLDYKLFSLAVIHHQSDIIKAMENIGYKLNPNMLLMEIFKVYMTNINNDCKIPPESNEIKIFTTHEFKYLVTNNYGLNSHHCLPEFYFLLMALEFEVAVTLLHRPYANLLIDRLNETFIGDENNLIEQILNNPEIIKEAICLALGRQVDTVAYEIFMFSGTYLDEKILQCAITGNCSVFLECVWNTTRKFGNIKNYYAPKICFSKYIECMLQHNKLKMASDAIKTWFEAYKEDNIFEILFEKNEEIAIDLIETASNYNYCVDLEGVNFKQSAKERYFLLRVILSNPMYKDQINSEKIQKDLVDALRKGHTILPAIECFNSIEEHLLSIEYVEHAGKVLIDFLKNPKNFAFCRYPLLLCCLVSEFMSKLKRRFPVYESFFDQIDTGFKKAGELFAMKIKDIKVIQYQLSRKDIKKRNCLQIMAQNRLYPILRTDYVGNIIDRMWSGDNILYGISDISSFTYMMRNNVEEEVFRFRNFNREYNKQKTFYMNFYSYRDVPSIRYYFKEAYGFVLVVMYQVLIYISVVDQNLENTVNDRYYLFSRLLYFLSLGQAFDKINSMVFFTFVPKWYMEMDPFLLWLSFAAVIFLHWFDFKSLFITGTDVESIKAKELINAVLLSYQFSFLWYKIVDSLKATKTYGGFLRTIAVLFKKMFLVIVFFYCFILLMTGVFNLLFQQTLQFQSYFDSFFYLAQAAQQQYELGKRWNPFVNFALIIYMGVCTLVLINLIIALATRIYDEADNNTLPEHRANLVKLYNYLRWNKEFGIFKFLFAPFNVLQLPFSIFILFPDDKEYWTNIFTKILYIPVALVFFVAFLIYQCIKTPIAFFHFIIVYPFKYGTSPKLFILHLFGSPIFFVYYFLRDIADFWVYSYQKPFEEKEIEREKSANEIIEFRKTFEMLINVISNVVEKNERKCKTFNTQDFIMEWITSHMNQKPNIETDNCMLKHALMLKKYNKMKDFHGYDNIKKKINVPSHEADENNVVHIRGQINKSIQFLERYGDAEGWIDKDIAKNLFPKKDYYDDDYFKFLFYFNIKHYKKIISHFTKMTTELKKDMNKLRGVYMDFLKINDKFKNLKTYLKSYDFSKRQINTLAYGINNINTVFAGFENNLNDTHAKELYEKITKQSQINARKNGQSSSLQNQGTKNDDPERSFHDYGSKK